MRILADFHHGALYHSLQLLEQRLGWELYRPIGMEWYNEGYWNVYPHPDTANQFLGLHQSDESPIDIHGNPLPSDACVNMQYTVDNDIYIVEDPAYGIPHRAVTLDKFSSMNFDVVLSSIPQHISLYNKLISNRMPRAKHVFQVGNSWSNIPGVRNILASTSPFCVDDNVNVCFYHQEFDLNLFYPSSISCTTTVGSFIHYMRNPELMKQVGSCLPGWLFCMYGAGANHLRGMQSVSETMRDTAFIWHYKPEGDGFGHVIHNAYACGRPAIVNINHYKGKLAEALLIPDVTCIDINGLTPQEVSQKLLLWSNNYDQISSAAYRRFAEVVNFDKDEELVREFMEKLL